MPLKKYIKIGKNANTTPACDAVVYISALVSNKKYKQGSKILINRRSQRSFEATTSLKLTLQNAKKKTLPRIRRKNISAKGGISLSAILIAINALPHNAIAPAKQRNTSKLEPWCVLGAIIII